MPRSIMFPTAVVTGAENWSPFAAMAQDPPDGQLGLLGHSPTRHAAVMSGGGEPRSLLMDGVFFGCGPGGEGGGRTITTTTAVGAAAPGSPGRRQQPKAGRAANGASQPWQEAVGESGDMRGGAMGSSQDSRGGGEGLAHLGVKEGGEPLGSRRKSLRRRGSTAAGAVGKEPSPSPGAAVVAGARSGGESLWDEEREELEAFGLGEGEGEGGQEDFSSDDEKDTPKAGPKRKQVGRPLKYKGDPNAPHLTEEERRRIKRRIANRESARRVRQKRNEYMDELQSKCAALSQQNSRLLTHVAGLESQNRALLGQVGLLREKYSVKVGESAQLYNALVHAKRLLLQLQGRVPSGELQASPKLPPMSSTTMPPVTLAPPSLPPIQAPAPLLPGAGASAPCWPLQPVAPVSPHQTDGGCALGQSQLYPNDSSALQGSGMPPLSFAAAGAQASLGGPNASVFGTQYNPNPSSPYLTPNASKPLPAAMVPAAPASAAATPTAGAGAGSARYTPPLLAQAPEPAASGGGAAPEDDPALSQPFPTAPAPAGLAALRHARGPSLFSSSNSLQLQDLFGLEISLPLSFTGPSQHCCAAGPAAQAYMYAAQQQSGREAEGGGQQGAGAGMQSEPVSREMSRSPTPFAFLS